MPPDGGVELIMRSSYRDATPSGKLMHIPREILFHILHQVHNLCDYLAVARTSKSLFGVVMDPAFLNGTLKKMSSTPSGCHFWLRPVAEMPGDEKNAALPLST
jgi:hypothetical protein